MTVCIRILFSYLFLIFWMFSFNISIRMQFLFRLSAISPTTPLPTNEYKTPLLYMSRTQESVHITILATCFDGFYFFLKPSEHQTSFKVNFSSPLKQVNILSAKDTATSLILTQIFINRYTMLFYLYSLHKLFLQNTYWILFH